MKGQFSLEFLTTYGWAFIVVLVAAGALAYFGVFSPGKYIPNKCEITPELPCTDYMIDSGDGSVKFKILNNYEKPIIISTVVATTYPDEALTCTSPGSINPGFDAEIICTTSTNPFVKGEKSEVKMEVTFRRDATGSTDHIVHGELFTNAI